MPSGLADRRGLSDHGKPVVVVVVLLWRITVGLGWRLFGFATIWLVLAILLLVCGGTIGTESAQAGRSRLTPSRQRPHSCVRVRGSARLHVHPCGRQACETAGMRAAGMRAAGMRAAGMRTACRRRAAGMRTACRRRAAGGRPACGRRRVAYGVWRTACGRRGRQARGMRTLLRWLHVRKVLQSLRPCRSLGLLLLLHLLLHLFAAKLQGHTPPSRRHEGAAPRRGARARRHDAAPGRGATTRRQGAMPRRGARARRHDAAPGRGATTRRQGCLLYTSPSPRDRQKSRMPSSA